MSPQLADYQDDDIDVDSIVADALGDTSKQVVGIGEKPCDQSGCTVTCQTEHRHCVDHCSCGRGKAMSVGDKCPQCNEPKKRGFKKGGGIPPRPDLENVELHWLCACCELDYTSADTNPNELRVWDAVRTTGYNYGENGEGMFTDNGDGSFTSTNEFEQDDEDWNYAVIVTQYLRCPECGHEVEVDSDGSVSGFVEPRWWDCDEDVYVTE